MAKAKAKTYPNLVARIVREPCDTYERRQQIRGGDDAASLLRAVLGARSNTQEHFLMLALDARHRVLGVSVVHSGTVSECPVSPRDVFLPAIAAGAVKILVAHNHPSGDPTPSADDRRMTERLLAAGELLGIELLDALVLGESRYYGFAEERFFGYSS